MRLAKKDSSDEQPKGRTITITRNDNQDIKVTLPQKEVEDTWR